MKNTKFFNAYSFLFVYFSTIALAFALGGCGGSGNGGRNENFPVVTPVEPVEEEQFTTPIVNNRLNNEEPPVVIVDTTRDVGRYARMVLGADGFARISYNDFANGDPAKSDLKFARCLDADCVDKNITVVDAVGTGTYTSMALGADGFARISYNDFQGRNLKFARCLDADCVDKNITIVDGVGGGISSVTLGADGFARIVYWHGISKGLKFARCLDVDCVDKNIIVLDGENGVAGMMPFITLGTDGFAQIAYYVAIIGDLKFARCLDADCVEKNITTVDVAGNVGMYTSIVLGADGLPRISYYSFGTNSNLRFARCLDADCKSKNTAFVDF